MNPFKYGKEVAGYQFYDRSESCFKRNVLTKNGKAKLDFAMALNDEPGVWKLRVTEPLTGVTSEKPFSVKMGVNCQPVVPLPEDGRQRLAD